MLILINFIPASSVRPDYQRAGVAWSSALGTELEKNVGDFGA